MGERLVIYRRAPNDLKIRVYDLIAPLIQAQLQVHPLGSRLPMEVALPEPPGLEEYRRLQAEPEEADPTDVSPIERR